ncbi:MAG: DNA-binding response regulator [Planctomycetota bacterium]|nr:MAG: DNA-binding response regulator [Planctomycetota bacterium]
MPLQFDLGVSRKRILIVEDQLAFRESLRRGLREEGYDVLATGTAASTLDLIRLEPVDAILLDLMLPDVAGLDLLKQVREELGDVPVLIMTARDSLEERIAGLDCGADDYLVKPFAFSELLARLRAILRRVASRSAGALLQAGELKIDSLARRVSFAGGVIDVTPREFELLEYLARHQGQVVSRQQLARDVWRSSAATWTNVIEVHINKLRKKLAVEGAATAIRTVRGQGYMLGDLES